MAKRNKKKDDTNGTSGEAQPEEIERKRTTMQLPCAIRPELVAMKGDELAKVVNLRLLLKEDKRTVLAGYREKLNHYDEQEKQLAGDIAQHTETRDVECIEYLITATQKVRVVRTDTLETVSERDATADDVQDEIEFPGDDATSGEPSGPSDTDPPPAGSKVDGEWTEGANPAPVT